LALAEQRGELANGQFFFGTQREQTQPVFVSEETEQVCAWSELHEPLFILECALMQDGKYMWQIAALKSEAPTSCAGQRLTWPGPTPYHQGVCDDDGFWRQAPLAERGTK
jgi:hypothetical protein